MVSSVFIEVYGCQMNKLDAELMLSALAADGMAVATSPRDARVVLINTCSVRGHAEERVWARLRSYQRRKEREPGFLLGVVGCMAQREGRNILHRAPFVDLVCGTGELARLPQLIRAAGTTGQAQLAIAAGGSEMPRRDISIRPRRSVAYVSVMRGCDYGCTYCIVPAVRGPAASREDNDVIDEIKRLADDGVVEVILLGQTVNSYRTPGGSSLGRLLVRAGDVAGIRRIRFVTSHPNDMSDELIDAMAGLPKVCRSLSLPAQSGSNRILRRMKRLYTVERYDEIVARLRERMPRFEVISDFIVGFPGETDDDFAATEALMRRVEFQTAYVFKYSPRPGTPAARLPDDVPAAVKADRNRELLRIQTEIATRRNAALIGRALEVLVEGPSRHDPARLSGRTGGNHIVIFEGDDSLIGRFVRVDVTDATSLTLRGRLETADAALPPFGRPGNCTFSNSD